MRRDIPHGRHHDYNRALALAPDDSLWATAADNYWDWAGVQRYTANGSFIAENHIVSEYATAGGIEFNGVDRMIVSTTDDLVQYGLDGSKIEWSALGSNYVDTPGSFFGGTASSMKLDKDGRILLLFQDHTRFHIIRYHPNGLIDTSFGYGGYVEISPGYEFFRASAIAVQPDGYIVIGGTAEVESGDRDFAMVRLCP